MTADPFASILGDARDQLQGVERPDLALDVVRIALVKQQRLIARRIRSEAAAASRGRYPKGCRSISYDAGMRRAARIAQTAGDPL